MDLQAAMDYVGEMCRLTMQQFVANKARLPSFGGPQINRDVAGYVQGLQNWIVGALHWSFMSTRYFGSEGAHVKKHRYVKLLPKKGLPQGADGEGKVVGSPRGRSRRWGLKVHKMQIPVPLPRITYI